MNFGADRKKKDPPKQMLNIDTLLRVNGSTEGNLKGKKSFGGEINKT